MDDLLWALDWLDSTINELGVVFGEKASIGSVCLIMVFSASGNL